MDVEYKVSIVFGYRETWVVMPEVANKRRLLAFLRRRFGTSGRIRGEAVVLRGDFRERIQAAVADYREMYEDLSRVD